MKIKHLFLFVLLIAGIYCIYRLIKFESSESQITYDNAIPRIKVSQLVGISEDRVRYSKSFYIKKTFVGFNAFIDEKYFITVTKLGKTNGNYTLIRSNKRPENNSDIIGFDPSDVEDQNSRYLNMDLSKYPFDIHYLYYYFEGDTNKVNFYETNFYEIEAIFNFFNLSFIKENRKDFGYVGMNKKNSISFIIYKNELYILNTFPINNTPYESLHTLINKGAKSINAQ